MSNEHPLPRSTTNTQRTPRVVTIPVFAATGLLLVFLAFQYVILPRSTYYRDIISNADELELQAFLQNDTREPLVLAVITERDDIDALARSVKLRGVWQPLDALIANSFRIRARAGHASTDIVIRGWDRLKHGRWFIRTSPSLMDTFVRIVQKSGGSMPSLDDLRRLPSQ